MSASVITAHHPDDRLAAVIDAALLSFSDVIVVDHTPTDADSLTEAALALPAPAIPCGESDAVTNRTTVACLPAGADYRKRSEVGP
jgi:hypothetical protein